MDTKPTPEERVWAVISHLSALAFGMGIVLPIVGWSEQRRKSKYTSFQCLQALGYQSLGYTVWLLSYLVLAIVFVLALMVAAAQAPGDSDVLPLWAGAFLLIMFVFLGLYVLFPLIGAVACALGRDFHYPLLGKRLASYLGYEPALQGEEPTSLDKTHEYRWVAAMGHFSVIIVFWGLLAPITAWILQGRQSAFLKFQSIQTTIYQVMVNLLYLAGVAIYFLGVIILFAMVGLEADPYQTSPTAILGLVIFLLSMLVATLILLIVPLFHILGQWAGYRVLKGENYRYPLIGKQVEKRMASPAVETNDESLDPQKELS